MMMRNEMCAKVSQAELYDIEEMSEFELKQALQAMSRMIKKTPHGEMIFEILKFEFRKRQSNN